MKLRWEPGNDMTPGAWLLAFVDVSLVIGVAYVIGRVVQ